MGKQLRALIVEDVERDALLLVRELERGGFDVYFERVETREAMSAALTRQEWDIVLSDYSMPNFSGLLAIELMNERNLGIPILIVSGTVGEDTAVEAMRAGAHDFIIKGRFARLIPAIERELRDASLRLERARMEEQLLISDRMASVGTLAAGVAHEINNPLAALIANLDFAAQDIAKLLEEIRLGADGRGGGDMSFAWAVSGLTEIQEPLRDAVECADRVRQIVRDLKIFSRSDEETRSAVDVRRVLESSLRMTWNEIRHRATLTKDYHDVPPVDGNEARLGQVFLNLIVNAAQAMPEGRAGKNEIRIVTKQDDRGRVVVEIRDTGSGIREADLSRIFDPFFTTKPIGVGTGLGLAICHRIISSIGGQILVESQEGVGTTFRVVLPAAVDAPAIAAAPAVASSVRRGRILVVDDEAIFGSAICRMLSQEHDVFAVTDARDAIQRVGTGERYDVILSDLMMPNVTGMDFHAEIMRLAPEQGEKMVFMTGGAFTSRAREFLDRVRNPRIEKPFDVGVLRSIVHSMMR